METIMILGAGVYQAPLYLRARARGMSTLGVSPKGNYPGLALADRTLEMDTRDREGILAAARREKIAAIATTGTDVAMPALGAVSDALGLPGVSLEAALRATDKIRMKEAFRAGGVRTSEFRAVTTPEEALAAGAEIGYPVMMKIPDKSGSRGITKANTPEALREAWGFSREATDAPRLLVEGFTPGTEFGIDAAIQGGRLQAVFPHEKRVHYSGRAGVPAGHLCPAAFPGEIRRQIEEQTRRITAALGLKDCAINIDAIITPEGQVSIIEAAARCGGTGIPEVIGEYLGIDWYDVILDLALGIPIKIPTGEEIQRIPRVAASRMITADRPGILRRLKYRAEGRDIENEDFAGDKLRVTLNVKPGDPVSDFNNGTERLGQAIFLGDSREEVNQSEAAFMRDLRVEVESSHD